MLKQLFCNKNTKWVILILFIAGLVLTDYFMHGYYNTEGYRGDALQEKKAGEYRVACFGGSTTFGYGVNADESWPAQLQEELQKNGNFGVANLAANTQGIFGISHDIKSYSYLKYDMAIIYGGVTDRNPETLSDYNFRGHDLFFNCFGYKTILGFYFDEILRKLTPLNPNENQGVFNKKNIQDNRRDYYAEVNQRAENMIKNGKSPYQQYITQLDEVLSYLIEKRVRTVLVCEPNSYNSIQQQKVRELLQLKYVNTVEYINLSELFPDFKTVSFDGMHLTPEGNKIVAKALRNSLF